MSVYLHHNDLILEELNPSHETDLISIADDPKIWTHNPEIRSLDDFKSSWLKGAYTDKNRITLVAKYHNKIIGSTSFYDICEKHKRLCIGYTWLSPDAWGTGINQNIKKLMIDYAFKTLNYNRVAFMIDANNIRSQKAVEKLGAIREGVLRHHMIRKDRSLRDTVVYSIINA